MTIRETKNGYRNQVLGTEIDPMVKARLRTLLELAVAIGKREGLLGNNVNEGENDVTD